MEKFAIGMCVLAIVANVLAFVVNMVVGNFWFCMIATACIAANVACLMYYRDYYKGLRA